MSETPGAQRPVRVTPFAVVLFDTLIYLGLVKAFWFSAEEPATKTSTSSPGTRCFIFLLHERDSGAHPFAAARAAAGSISFRAWLSYRLLAGLRRRSRYFHVGVISRTRLRVRNG